MVWAAVCRLLENPHLIEDAWAYEQTPPGAAPDEVDRLQARLRTLEQQWTRLLDAFQADLLSQAQLAERKAVPRPTAWPSSSNGCRRYSNNNGTWRAKSKWWRISPPSVSRCWMSLHSPTPELQQEVIRLLIDHIIVNEDAIVIRHVIPTDDDCRLLFGRRQERIGHAISTVACETVRRRAISVSV